MRNRWHWVVLAAGLGMTLGLELTCPGAWAAPAVAPEIVLAGRTRASRAVEARLAGFVRAVRRRDGERAARYMSRTTARPVRLAVARREWPWRTAPEDLGRLFRSPALRLRTIALQGNRARVRIAPQQVDRDSTEPAGFYDVEMTREGNRWQVRLPVSGVRRKA